MHDQSTHGSANVLIHVNDNGVVEPRVTDFGLALRESDANLGEGRKRLGTERALRWISRNAVLSALTELGCLSE
jgi:hypothetical protein